MRELGIRVALGATKSQILRLALGDGITFAALGAVLGIAGAVGATRVLRALLFGVGATDPLTYLATAGVLALATIVAALAPAQRAGSANPVGVLREVAVERVSNEEPFAIAKCSHGARRRGARGGQTYCESGV